MMGSPKKRNPTPNAMPFSSIYEDTKKDSSNGAKRHAANVILGRSTGNGGVGLRALPNRSQVSTTSESMRMMGPTLVQTMLETGFFVLSCFVLIFSPSAESLALDTSAVMLVGSGAVLSS